MSIGQTINNNNNTIVNNSLFNINEEPMESDLSVYTSNDNNNDSINNNNNNNIINNLNRNRSNEMSIILRLYRLSEQLNRFRENINRISSSSIRKMLDRTTIRNVSELSDNKRSCLICLEDFKNREKIYSLKCNHIFHIRCLNKWIKRNHKCPICRTFFIN